MKSKMNLIVTGLLLICFVTSAFADMQTITLNTGFNHATNQRYTRPSGVNWKWTLPALVNHKDEYWTLIHDPVTNNGTPVPRQADIMPYVAGPWIAEMPNSEWIAFERNGIPKNDGKDARAYVFEKCFCLKKGFDAEDAYKKTVMDLQLRADDWAAVYLNQTLPTILSPKYPVKPYKIFAPEPDSILQISAASGGFGNPVPAKTTISGSDLIKQLKVGRNCLQVKLYDLGLAVSGFNLTGGITAQGIDEVARFDPKNPKQQFSQCSSCLGKKLPDVNSVFDVVDKIKNGVQIRPAKP